nr:MAG TPA: hypothetical protein [Caudoviricetes sp.]
MIYKNIFQEADLILHFHLLFLIFCFQSNSTHIYFALFLFYKNVLLSLILGDWILKLNCANSSYLYYCLVNQFQNNQYKN